MSPRTYNLGRRLEASNETRARIVEASRDLLASPRGTAAFTVEAVARRAGVARMTVYYQFKSKRGLLDALYDDLARRGGIFGLGEVFQKEDPLDALDAFVGVFGKFWSTDRLAMRRIRALGALDPEVEASLRERDSWRANAIAALLERLKSERGLAGAGDETGRLILALTSFELFDDLAGDERSPLDVAPLVQQLVRSCLGVASA